MLSALPAVVWTSGAAPSETKVIINLSEQRAYLIEQGKVTLVSPVASGKPAWATPTGNFRIFDKDLDHRSRSFGSVVDCYGKIVNSNATPTSHVPAGGHYRPAPMPYFMEFSPAVGMHAGYLPGYPASHLHWPPPTSSEVRSANRKRRMIFNSISEFRFKSVGRTE